MSAGRTVVLRQSGGARPPLVPPAPVVSTIVDGRVKEGEEVEGMLLGWALTNAGWTPGDGDSKAGIQVFYREGARNRSPTTSPTPDSKSTGSGEPEHYHVWKCCGEVAGSAEDVYRLMIDTEMMPRWNHDVTSYRVLEKLNEQTDVVHCVSAASASGTVSPRDFVMLRRRTRPNADTFVIADTGTTHSKAIPSPDGSIVRGWNGPGGIVIRKLAPNSNTGGARCWVCWILNKDLRGWLPRTLVDQVLATVLKDCIKNLRSAITNIHIYFPPPPTAPSQPISSSSSQESPLTLTKAIACPN